MALYVNLFDYGNAKKYIQKAIHLYEESSDETLRRQSLSRLYYEWADAFPIGADSVRINIDKAWECAKEPMDTLRCEYHKAKLSAFYKDIPAYKRSRDYCLASGRSQRKIPNLDAHLPPGNGTYPADSDGHTRLYLLPDPRPAAQAEKGRAADP